MNQPNVETALADAREDFVKWLRGTQDFSDHTVRAYAGDVASLERYVGSATPLGAIDSETLVNYFEFERSNGSQSSTLRRRVCGLRRFIAFVRLRNRSLPDPWPEEVLRFRPVQSLPRAIPRHDLSVLLNHLIGNASAEHPSPERLLQRPHETTTLLCVSLILATGIRVSEAVGVKIENVEIQDRSLQIMGKGRRERVVYVGEGWIIELLRSHMEIRRRLEIDHAFLLFNKHKGPLSTSSVRRRLARATINSGLCRRVTPHMLRHSAATQLIESGVDIRIVQRMLGHASLATTEIYTHVSNGALKEAITSADVLGQTLAVERDN